MTMTYKKINSLTSILVTLLLAALFMSGCATTPHHRGAFLPAPLAAQRIRIGRTAYLPLSALVQELRAQQSVDPDSRVWSVEVGPHKMRVAPLIKAAVVDGAVLDLPDAPVLQEGELFLPESFWSRWFSAWVVPAPVSPAGRRLKTIVLDPGHGGRDPGAIGRNGIREKQLTLDIALRLREILERDGFRVIMTRSDDTFISLQRRAEIANEANADLFVSIHANASKRKGISGFEVYYLSDATDDHARALESVENGDLPVDTKARMSADTQVIVWDLLNSAYRTQSRDLADAVCRGLRSVRVPFENRGVKSARFAVLKGSRMPAVLIEVGFITNPSEGSSLKMPGYRQRLADGIRHGIGTFRMNDERSS